jgi:hypothetical protein
MKQFFMFTHFFNLSMIVEHNDLVRAGDGRKPSAAHAPAGSARYPMHRLPAPL